MMVKLSDFFNGVDSSYIINRIKSLGYNVNVKWSIPELNGGNRVVHTVFETNIPKDVLIDLLDKVNGLFVFVEVNDL